MYIRHHNDVQIVVRTDHYRFAPIILCSSYSNPRFSSVLKLLWRMNKPLLSELAAKLCIPPTVLPLDYQDISVLRWDATSSSEANNSQSMDCRGCPLIRLSPCTFHASPFIVPLKDKPFPGNFWRDIFSGLKKNANGLPAPSEPPSTVAPMLLHTPLQTFSHLLEMILAAVSYSWPKRMVSISLVKFFSKI